MGDPAFIDVVVLPILGMIMGGGFLWGVYRTVNRALERRHERMMVVEGAPTAHALEELRGRVEVLEDVNYRMQELEERLDFAERMLAQQQRKGLESGRMGE